MNEALAAFHALCRLEGIIPALESSHAVAQAIKLAPTLGKDAILLVNLSSHDDKNMHTWILMSLGPSVLFFAFWHGGRLGRCLGFLAANLAAFLLPPLALVGIMAPWMGTGCLFPGWGWWGLLALMGIYFACALFRPFACGFLLLLLLLGCLGWAELKPIDGKKTGNFLWEEKHVVPFLKIDKEGADYRRRLEAGEPDHHSAYIS